MAAYSATFSDGSKKELKNSKREYAAAWQAKIARLDGSVHVVSGFARTADLAKSSARSEAAMITRSLHKLRRGQPIPLPLSIEVVPAVSL